MREDGTGALQFLIERSISIRPSARSAVRLSANHMHGTSPAQYVSRVPTNHGSEYVVGELEQRVLSGALRLDYTFTPTFSLQLWAQPFLASGRYTAFREVERPRARSFDERYLTLAADRITRDEQEGTVSVDRDGDGTAEYSFGTPNFSFRELHSNLVLRWEYRPARRHSSPGDTIAAAATVQPTFASIANCGNCSTRRLPTV